MLNTSAESAGAGRSAIRPERCWVRVIPRMRHCTGTGLAGPFALRLQPAAVEGHRGRVARHQFEFAEVPGRASRRSNAQPRSPRKTLSPSAFSTGFLGGHRRKKASTPGIASSQACLSRKKERAAMSAPRGVRADPLQVDSDFAASGNHPAAYIRSGQNERNGARAGQVRFASASAANTRLSGARPVSASQAAQSGAEAIARVRSRGNRKRAAAARGGGSTSAGNASMSVRQSQMWTARLPEHLAPCSWIGSGASSSVTPRILPPPNPGRPPASHRA